MQLCNKCGGEIIFRNVAGVITPIHLSGGCWNMSQQHAAPTILRFEAHRDLCRHTPCPRCESMVYFIRHNDGSLWVDELGWPWPKHACFADASGDRSSLQILVDKSRQLNASEGGIVTRVAFVAGLAECLLVIVKPGSPPETWLAHGVDDPRMLVGALVLMLVDRGKVLHTSNTSYNLTEPIWSCAVCSAEVFASAYDTHMAESHGVTRCPQCGAFINRTALEQHLKEHQRESRRNPKKNCRPENQPSPSQLKPSTHAVQIDEKACPHGHGPLRAWEGMPRCWTCGYPMK
jgi:hypothetical protein